MFAVLVIPLLAALFELAKPAGLAFTHRNSPTSQKYLIETMGAGVALLDYNNDGLLDIFLVNGGNLTAGMKAGSSLDRGNPRFWNRLYRQNRDGSFTDVTSAAGLAKVAETNYGMGVTVGDFDN